MTKTTQRPVHYFIRDDDVGALTEALRFFVETFFERELPVSYQIIPANFTQEAADYLLEKWRARPDLIEFGQHGLTHSMIVRGRQIWREFGPERSYEEQSRDIAEGMRILRDRLGDEPPIRVFTPPQHKYDGATVRAAAAAGHRIFSGSSYPSRHHQLAYRMGRALGLSSLRHHGISYHERVRPEASIAELSISIPVDNGGALLLSAGSIRSALDEAAAASSTVGLMFHHAVYDAGDRRRALTAIAEAITAHAGADDAVFRLLGACPTQRDQSIAGE